MDFLEFEKPLMEIEHNIAQLKEKALSEKMDFSTTIAALEKEVLEKKRELYGNLTPDQTLKIARHPERPKTLDYIEKICTDFIELHGDRLFGDDPAIVGGLANIDKHRIIIMGQQKGYDTKDKVYRNFGTAHPEGYRKALRLMKMAHRFGLPIITLIDTPGAYPGIGAEERGQAAAIAVNLKEMMELEVPVIPVIIGEGGSGGALGIGVGDRILMLEHAYYSVISPEGCATILWKSTEKTSEAASALKMTARDLLGLGIIDQILLEPLGGSHRDPDTMAQTIKSALQNTLDELGSLSGCQLTEARLAKFRKIGVYNNGNSPSH